MIFDQERLAWRAAWTGGFLQFSDKRFGLIGSPKIAGELRFTTRMGGGASGAAGLETAWQSGIPVEGRLEKETKGGFEVRIHGLRAFCPLSQIERGFCNEPERYIGQKLPFEIINLERNGRNIVLSRRKLLLPKLLGAFSIGDVARKAASMGERLVFLVDV